MKRRRFLAFSVERLPGCDEAMLVPLGVITDAVGLPVKPHRAPTARQLEVLRYIAESFHARGTPPSIREICKRLRVTGTRAAAEHLERLVQKRLIDRTIARARGIQITQAGWEVLRAS